MTEGIRLLGQYSSGQHVLVHGETSQVKLRLLGCFGTNLEDAKRKPTTRRGPSDQHLIDNLDNQETDTDQSITILTLHEAFFLAYSLGCLSIYGLNNTSDTLSLENCWSEFRKYHLNSNIRLDFATEYAVFHYFRSRGWVVKGGDNYGASFLLYKKGPSVDHAQYAVIILLEDDLEDDSYKWTSLLTFHRVIQSVSKELLLTFVTQVGNNDSKFETPNSIRGMRIATRIFTAQANTLN